MSRRALAVAQAILVAALAFAGSLAGTPAQAGPFMTALHPIKQPEGAGTLCRTYAWACETTHAASTFTAADMAMVRRVNARVNRNTPQITDQSQYARAEVWALPTRRGGDCEDFALLKKRELIDSGIAPDRLLIATVLDTHFRGHAVLVVRTGQGDIVLDNLTNRIRAWDDTGYIFLKMQSPDTPGGWDAIVAGGLLLTADQG